MIAQPFDDERILASMLDGLGVDVEPLTGDEWAAVRYADAELGYRPDDPEEEGPEGPEPWP